MVSLRLDGITTANLATLQHRCVHSQVSAVMLGSHAEYPIAFGSLHHHIGSETPGFEARNGPCERADR
jgi:hypothetical protein